MRSSNDSNQKAEIAPNTVTEAPGGAVDGVRASRDGHAFHEAWAGRSALALLPPDTTLTAIAIEGFSVEDGPELSPATVEVADLVRYHGGRHVAEAQRAEIVQFKYSIASATTPVRAADLRKTLEKFAKSEVDLRRKHGDALVDEVVRYEYATNRPIHPNLTAAIEALRDGTAAEGDVTVQADQIRAAVKAGKAGLKPLVDRLRLQGGLGTLKNTRRALGRTLANWGVPEDPQSRLRLLELEALIRDKAGSAGQDDNLIDRVAVLAALDLEDERRDLYPTPDAFPPVESVIERPILADIVARARAAALPLLVHGDGGMGKTVLMQGIADRLGDTHEVVVFDGFGAGKWRDPADGRHRPGRTLVHLANLLAAKTLSDILLRSNDEEGLLRAFRRRLEQAVAGVRQSDAEAGIALLLDAIDHAGIEARDTGTRSFAHMLLKSLAVTPIDGVILVASCRTSRIDLATGGAAHEPFPIPQFTPAEARQLILARDPKASEPEIAALESRSGRNPRCLDTLIGAGRPYDRHGPGDGDPSEVLDALLTERIAEARAEAVARGTSEADVNALLSGLSLLPPPVPMAELAAAQGLSAGDVESFAADLAPLLERTPHGLMFRDEPIETLIRKMADADPVGRDAVVARLAARQDVSDYAARALPPVLTATGRGGALFELAFDERVPPNTSKVGKRDIRLARIMAALQSSAREGQTDALLKLELEAALVAAGHARSDRFLYEHPDLAAIGGDAEALRRLFATKAGWPGGRHAALAIGHAFAGDMGEAQRNAVRAIDWFNWQIRQPPGKERDTLGASTSWDEVGFAYVELIAGDQRRMIAWLGRAQEALGYHVAADVHSLLERHAVADPSIAAVSDRLRNRLSYCRTKARAIWAAAAWHSDGDAARDRRMLRRLAAVPVPEKPGVPRQVLLAAAARAIGLKMHDEARAILRGVQARAGGLYAFDAVDRVEREAIEAVLAGGLTAALGRRSVALIDIAPVDVLAMVPASLRRRGPGVFDRELQKRLGAPVRKTRKKEERSYADTREGRERRERAVKERLRPLLPFAESVRQLVRDPPAKRAATLDAALAALEQVVAKASNYPYRDEARFLARIGSAVLFETADALHAIDAPAATRLANWLAATPGFPIGVLTAIAERLSRRADGYGAAMTLATRIEALILAETDTSHRIRAYGELARAVWRVSVDEAAAYFRRALDLADAIGSDDFDRANSLLELGGRYHGPPVEPAASHALARIFELNLGDDDRYPWDEWAAAMRGTAGLGSLPMLSRLDDRGAARLGYTFPPTLTELVSAGLMPADLASALIGIAPPSEGRGWRLDHFARAAMPGLSPVQRSWLFDVLIVEIDRTDGLSPWRKTVAGLLGLAEQYLPQDAPARVRLAAFHRDGGEEPEAPMGSEHAPLPPLPEVPLGDPDEIDRMIELDAQQNNGHRWPQRALGTLVERARLPAERLTFLDALVDSTGADLDDKLDALDPVIEDWTAHSAALRDRLPTLGLRLAARHAVELTDTSWRSDRIWERLVERFRVGRSTLAAAVVRALGTSAQDVSGDNWLGLSAKLAPAASQQALGEGIGRLLLLAGATIPDEVGDGPWDDRFAHSANPVEISAGLIWFRLGNPVAQSRWRAAHALVRMAQLGRADVIAAVAARAQSDGADPFADRNLPFFTMHARLWLLIALARIARDHPEAVSPHRDMLERIAFDSSFPHLGMRHFAGAALRAILPVLDPAQRAALEPRLDALDRPPIAPIERKGYHGDVHGRRPAGMVKPADDFTLEYDFNKNQVGSLMRRFGLESWRVRDAITGWVRQWDGSVSSMWDCARSRDGDGTGRWGSRDSSEVDRYGGYLAWHALQLVAGDLLATRPLSTSLWGDPMDEMLERVTLSRRDGLWLSELTDLMPADLSDELLMPRKDSRKPFVPDDARTLAPFVGFTDGAIRGSRLTVAGDWTLAGGTEVSVVTFLASPKEARAALLSAMLDEPFFRWIPHDAEDLENDFPGAKTMRCWINWVEQRDRRLDSQDPYAAATALARPRPSAWLCETQGITAEDIAGRRWSTANGIAFNGEAWGGPEGRYEEGNGRGERLCVEMDFLLPLLAAEKLVLGGLIKARAHHPKKGDEEEGGFAHRALLFLVDRHGRVTIPQRVPGPVRDAVRKLPRQDRSEFGLRFKAILPILR